MNREDISDIRIVRRETHWTGSNFGAGAMWHTEAYPFSEIFIVANGQNYLSRVFYQLDNTHHAREAQAQDFLRRQNRHSNGKGS